MQALATTQAQEFATQSGLVLINAPAAQTFESIANAILENERQIMALTELVTEQRADLISQITTAMRKLNITTKDIQAVLNDGAPQAEDEIKPRRTRAPRGSRKAEEAAAQQGVAAASVGETASENEVAPIGDDAPAVEAAPTEQTDVPAEAEITQEPAVQSAAGEEAGVDLSEIVATLDGEGDGQALSQGESMGDDDEEGVSLADAVRFDAPWASRNKPQSGRVAI